jgi:hypothetical protein
MVSTQKTTPCYNQEHHVLIVVLTVKLEAVCSTETQVSAHKIHRVTVESTRVLIKKCSFGTKNLLIGAGLHIVSNPRNVLAFNLQRKRVVDDVGASNTIFPKPGVMYCIAFQCMSKKEFCANLCLLQT